MTFLFSKAFSEATSTEGNIFRKQVVKGFALWNYKSSNRFLVLDLFLAILGIQKVSKGFPLLLGGAICILNTKYSPILISPEQRFEVVGKVLKDKSPSFSA